MKNWRITGLCAILTLGFILMSGCTSPGSTDTAPRVTPASQIVTESVPPTQTPALSPVPTPAADVTEATGDPIIGSWLNGMVFNADGTVGSDGYTTWRTNKDGSNSYFVITNVLLNEANNDRSVTSTEWIYNPFSDKINIRGSSQTFARGIPAPVTTPITTPVPVITTLQTPAEEVPLIEDGNPGTLTILTGGGLGVDVTVYIAREGSTVQPINSDPYANLGGDQNPGYLKVKILPNGETSSVSLVPGRYIAYLPSKGGGEPEQQAFTINPNCNTIVSFSAYSYRASSGGGCGG